MIARLALAAATLSLGACIIEHTGPTQHESQSIDLDKAERVQAEFRMGAGTLRLSPGTDKLMRADFSYNVVSWKPYVHYNSAAGSGHLSVEQPESGPHHIGHCSGSGAPPRVPHCSRGGFQSQSRRQYHWREFRRSRLY